MNLWPFGKSKPAEISPATQLLRQLMQWRSLGQTFDYLGRTCIVTGHWWVVFDDSVTGITADYADELGVIHSIKFGPGESRGLMERDASVQT